MAITTATHPELLWPGIVSIFGNKYKQYSPIWASIFTKMKSDKAFEKVQGLTELGLAAVKNQGASITYDDTFQGFQKEFVNVTYAKGAVITQEMIEDDQYNQIQRITEHLATSMRRTEETVGANIFNSAFSTSTTPSLAADGLSVCNASHLLVGGGTFSNQPATAADLTATSLQQAHIDISKFVDDRNLPILVQAKKLLVPNELYHVAMEILETEYKPGTNDNDINTVSSARMPLELIRNPYLTDSDAWFLITDAQDGALFMDRVGTQLDRDNDFDTKNLKFSVRRRFSVGVADPRGVYGSPGA